MKRALQLQDLATLRADIDASLAYVAAGRVKDFDAARIIERGSYYPTARPPSECGGGSYWPIREPCFCGC
jgi:antitoxin ParD1/3/4